MTATRDAADGADRDLVTVIAAGARQLAVDLDGGQIDRLVAYLHLIDHWNGTYNLTAVRGLSSMATHHVLDSLSAVPTIRRLMRGDGPPRMLDVGSGAGLPGVVVAISEPGLAVVCVDSVGKKTAFVTSVAATLGLPNLTAVHARVESLPVATHYPIIVSRAFASLSDFVSSTRHLLQVDGRWLAMKGKIPHQELVDVAEMEAEFDVEQTRVPGLNAERCLLTGRDLNKSKR